MISRTYPAEYSLFSGDEVIISSIRDRIGDRPAMRRYYLTIGSQEQTQYVVYDNHTFYDEETRFWPYHLLFNSTTYSGLDNPQVINYQYMQFEDSIDLSSATSDFWVETFYLSDFEIWTAYLSVDLTPLLRNTNCVTDEMNILKAAIDLVPALRTSKARYFYSSIKSRDNDTDFEQGRLQVDPYKDLVTKMRKELDTLIYECNHRLYQGGYRIE